jgi:hypothetical protein
MPVGGQEEVVGRPAKRTNASPAARNLSWEDAIQQVLKDADGALHYAEISERIVSKGLRQSVGATPAATVAANLSSSLKEKSSPYLRVGRGQYTLKTVAEKPAREDQTDDLESPAQEEEAGALRAFGMFWQRAWVLWSGPSRLLGRQGLGATDVNFADQVGVYLLHDRERVIYVGRATDGLFPRLKAHTADRLGGRWDRFSWFGLRSVKADGKLSNSATPWNEDVVVETMEALLIESLEPPLNRRRGDNLSGIEYVQVEDSQIAVERKKALINELSKAL